MDDKKQYSTGLHIFKKGLVSTFSKLLELLRNLVLQPGFGHVLSLEPWGDLHLIMHHTSGRCKDRRSWGLSPDFWKTRSNWSYSLHWGNSDMCQRLTNTFRVSGRHLNCKYNIQIIYSNPDSFSSLCRSRVKAHGPPPPRPPGHFLVQVTGVMWLHNSGHWTGLSEHTWIPS